MRAIAIIFALVQPRDIDEAESQAKGISWLFQREDSSSDVKLLLSLGVHSPPNVLKQSVTHSYKIHIMYRKKGECDCVRALTSS